MATTWQDPDLGKSPDLLCGERDKRIQDAIELKQPDRIPILMGAGYLLAEMGGINRKELYDNPAKARSC
jgi:hypothetical protein